MRRMETIILDNTATKTSKTANLHKNHTTNITMGNALTSRTFSKEPKDKESYTNDNDRVYTRIAQFYNVFARNSPFWKRWLHTTLPYIRGPKVLEVSCGTGYLLTQIVDTNIMGNDYSREHHPDHEKKHYTQEEIHAVDINEKLLSIAQKNLRDLGTGKSNSATTTEDYDSTPCTIHSKKIHLVKANVEDLPFPNGYFDTVVVTMAFTGYPDGHRAMSELIRVLKKNKPKPSMSQDDPGGRLVMVDIGYPKEGATLGVTGGRRSWSTTAGIILTNLWKAAGDIIRDIGALMEELGLDYTDEEIGAFGSVHLYVATQRQ